jgi:MFS family permease
VFLAGALVSFVLAAAFYMQVSRSPAIHSLRETQENDQPEADVPEETSMDETYSAILTDTKMVAFLTVAVIVTFAWNGLSSFLPLYFAQAKAMSVGNASLLYSLLFMTSFSQAVTGWLSDTLGRVRMILILLLLVAIGISIMLYTDSLLGLGVATVIAGVGFHGFRPVRDSYFMVLIPSSVGGGTLGIVRTVMVTIGAAGPAILGYFSDVVGFPFAIAFVISITLLAMVVVGLFLRN